MVSMEIEAMQTNRVETVFDVPHMGRAITAIQLEAIRGCAWLASRRGSKSGRRAL